MKQVFRLRHVLLVMVAASLVVSACQKMPPIPKKGKKTVFETIASDKRFEFLAAAVIKAELVQTLNDRKASFTVFAPTNDAFKAAGFMSIQDIASAPKEALQAILLYHVLGSEVKSGDLPVAANTEVATVGGKKIYVTRTSDNKVFVNGVSVIQKDLDATNGVIHVINRVLIPPPGNLVELASSNANLSFLVAAVVRASQGSVNVAAVLSGDGPFTVFAPTNDAFKAAGFNTIADINAADPAVLTNILTYHVIGARVFSSDLADNISVPTLNGGNVTITLGGGPKVKGNSNATPSNIVATDIMATNGVVHVIDQVLLP